jgi:putative DNA methylase
LTTFSDLVDEARAQIRHDAVASGLASDAPFHDGGTGAMAYAEAIATFLSFAVSKSADYWSNICTWRSDPKNLGVGHVFARQALPKTWDFAEGNPFSNSSGSFLVSLDRIARVIAMLPGGAIGQVSQEDAQTQTTSAGKIISTDPPYYDNVPYADLSDFLCVAVPLQHL